MNILRHFTKFGTFLKKILLVRVSKKEKGDNIFQKILNLRAKEDVRGIRKLEWKIFRWTVTALFIFLAAVFTMGMLVLGWWGKIFLFIAFCGLIYALYELLGKRIIRWVNPLEVSLLIDKFTGRTDEVGTEGIIITLPTDKISTKSIEVKRFDVTEDYLTMDGSITLTNTVFYTIYPPELKDFLIVEVELKNALASGVQELFQSETGDRTTDEVITEQRSLSEQLRTELTGSRTEILLGRLGINRRKIADLEGKKQILEELIKRLETATENKEKSEKELIKRTKIDSEKERDKLVESQNRRLNLAAELIQELIIRSQEILSSPGTATAKQISKDINELRLSFADLPLEKSSKSKEWIEVIKGNLNNLEKACSEVKKVPVEVGDKKETGRERTGLEKDFHINIIGSRLYNPTLDEKAKVARDAKVTMKYKQEAIVTEYATTKKVLQLLKEQLPYLADKEFADYILATRGKMTPSKEEKIYNIPGLNEVLSSALEKLFKPKAKPRARSRSRR
ncbi:MAG: hypothetical protein NT136_00780 [Candidatus Moranbacteria bacterium]|nr:hypothetical protein [Candidatus Moranbacteria bacterium]